ncbi:MAG: 50S ribosomal protein L3 [Candidatus Marinimicrobia bacterium]|nr:50S ribosomal protein L3 [Candidatus Neomarinimicrobiota bacterium]
MLGILGKKIGMSQVFTQNGNIIPVTVVEAGPCKVVQVKTVETDGYNAAQIGFEEKPERLMIKPEKGHFEKHNTGYYRTLAELKDADQDIMVDGAEITVSKFKIGDKLKVTGTSKGKGFQGVMKRHNFSGAQTTHGQSDRRRAPGSIGASAYPSRVIKGMRMAGQTGNKRKTVSNLELVKIDEANNLLYIKGAVPGGKNGILTIRKQEK